VPKPYENQSFMRTPFNKFRYLGFILLGIARHPSPGISFRPLPPWESGWRSIRSTWRSRGKNGLYGKRFC
jgi:hypothetical protein